MKPYLTDVPVAVYLWIRPDLQRRQFEVLKQARPSILFLASDGGRNEEEWAAINQNRKMFDEEIDWDCTVYRYYASHNHGMYANSAFVNHQIWEITDRCIFLEDDILPSVSFFEYCRELLEKYKDDTRISMICGMNHLGVYDACSSDYFFSRYGSVWGVAYWKRTIEYYKKDQYKNDPYNQSLLRQAAKDHPMHQRQIRNVIAHNSYDGHQPGSEYFINLSVYNQHQVMIIPKYNLISNIGCDEKASHGDALENLPRGIRRVFDMKTYELQFPLKHPDYVIPDETYEKKRNWIMALDHPLLSLSRHAERAFLLLKHGQGDRLLSMIRHMKEKEK